MIEAIYTSATGLDASQSLLDVTGNNLANVNTAGYKTVQVSFQDLFYRTLEEASGNPDATDDGGGPLPAGIQLGTGVALASTTGLFTQGPLQPTGMQLDLAISGQGFFQVALPDGSTAYTRDGAFQINAAGQVVTSQGFQLLPGITVPAGTTGVSISPTGVVTAATPNGPVTLGQITLARFVNPQGLTRIGSNLFLATDNSGDPQVGAPGSGGRGTLRQGFLEGSNVEVATELTNLLIAQRTFTFNSQAIVVTNQMLDSALELI